MTDASPAPGEGGSGCFPAATTVELAGGGSCRMDSLAVGDTVRTGTTTYSPVYAFSHADSAVAAEYVTLTAATGALTLTPGHYVYVQRGACTAGGGAQSGAAAVTSTATCTADDARFIAAAAVTVGDALWHVPADSAEAVDVQGSTTVTLSAAAVVPPPLLPVLAPPPSG